MHPVLPDVTPQEEEVPLGDPQGGFSLLEVSLVLAVMGVVAASGLSLMTNRMTQAKERVTHEHQELLFKTLANYTLSHNALPCPSADTEGQARLNCQTPQEATGYLPYATLGLPQKIAKDGWGRIMHYAVHPEMTTIQREQTALEQLDALCRQRDEHITVRGLHVPTSLSSDPIAVVLYSQGTAFGQRESQTERTNTSASLVFVDMPLSMRADNPHRHLLAWLTRDTLLAHHAHFSCPQFLLSQRSPAMDTGSHQDTDTSARNMSSQINPWGGFDDQ